ncbi:transketolase [Micromonospora sp. KC723]|uniref:transketolase n=1 Tax=Micromonospora sp. KC723 TaxID=2530381 RepID=UPI00104EB2A4|nr:transketolase [Micromonospora sp. KC723]TDB78267.1 transketolase [Micromonospora sp. KC723]
MTVTAPDLTTLHQHAHRIRERIVDVCAGPEGGHLGGSLSLVEVLTALYFDVMRVDPDRLDDPDRDIFLLSKGHAGIGLYCTLAERGYFDPAELAGYARSGGRFMAHPTRSIPGVEMPTGSLGHGPALAIGFAMAARLAGSKRTTYVVLGDGELQEGSVWEAAMGAAGLGLDNLVAVVDRNGLQLTGGTESICRLEPVGERWRSFGWSVTEVDGQDLEGVRDALASAPWEPGRPSVLVARTTKGAGVPFVAGTPRSHYVALNERQHARARSALRRAAGGDRNG